MSQSLIGWISMRLNRLFSNNRLTNLEKLVLDAWRSSLSIENQLILQEQLVATDLVQRQAGGAKVCFYMPKKNGARLFSVDGAICVATITIHGLDAAVSHEMKCRIYVVNGRFFSIEFPKRPDRYMKLHGMTPTQLCVSSVKVHHEL